MVQECGGAQVRTEVQQVACEACPSYVIMCLFVFVFVFVLVFVLGDRMWRFSPLCAQDRSAAACM